MHIVAWVLPSRVGVVRIQRRGGDTQEMLALVSVSRLNDAELADVRADALRLDRRTYTSVPDVYGGTAPAHKLP
jgi:hypothetical protein